MQPTVPFYTELCSLQYRTVQHIVLAEGTGHAHIVLSYRGHKIEDHAHVVLSWQKLNTISYPTTFSSYSATAVTPPRQPDYAS